MKLLYQIIRQLNLILKSKFLKDQLKILQLLLIKIICIIKMNIIKILNARELIERHYAKESEGLKNDSSTIYSKNSKGMNNSYHIFSLNYFIFS